MKISRVKNRDLFYTNVELPYEEGKKRNRTKVYGKTRQEVRDKAAELIRKAAEGTWIKESDLTVESYFRFWFKLHSKGLKPYTRDGYKLNIEKHIIPALGSIPIKKLTALKVEKFYAALLDHGRLDGKGGLSPTSVKYIHRVINIALEDARIKKLISSNPMDGVRIPKQRRPVIKEYDENQLVNLLINVRDHELEPLIILIVGTGLRRGEVLGLQWSNIDIKTGRTQIVQELIYDKESKELVFTSPKSDDGIRTIYMPRYVLEALERTKARQDEDKEFYGEEYKDYDLVICQSNGEPISPNTITKRFEKLLNRMEWPKTTLHALRHAFGSLHSKYNTPLRMLADSMGHSDPNFTAQRYQKTHEDMKIKVARATEGKLFKKVRKKIYRNQSNMIK